MIIVKSPLRISFFGGSTDYESFYKEHGSFIIGTTIDKYIWLSARYRPKILPKEHSIAYSKLEVVSSFEEVQNPLIREVLKYHDIRNHIDFTSSADVPSRTGLGGSSSFCAGMIHLMKNLKGEFSEKKDIAKTAIHIERNILKESGGIQDQIWAAYGGFNTIKIDRNGDFEVTPIPVSDKFKRELEESIVLIYTNDQRNQNEIAQSHENKDKKKILDLSLKAYDYFIKEDIRGIGELLLESWNEKRKISSLISTEKIDKMAEKVMSMGAYGIKLLGSGGCGFLMVICNSDVKKKIVEEFKENILEFKFEDKGTSIVYPN
ncbi:MAG: kinase [Candidatus Paceibacterota bacterium]|jgi:D-glycero-alpha-D-manno-heptose-7-phosphate kinase